MHEELVKSLRTTVMLYGAVGQEDLVTTQLMKQAADAIEELSRAQEQWIEQERKMLLKSIPRWIPVTERLPEESEGLDFHEDMMIRFTSVWCCDAKTGTIEVRNRFQGKMTGNKYLDQYTKDTDWHWSKSWWEPTHWMPIVPLPEPPEGDGSRDFDLLDGEDWYGITLDGAGGQPYSEYDRIDDALYVARQYYGIKTWCSFEPVVDAKAVLDYIQLCGTLFNKIKIGKLNYHPSDINWKEFGMKAEALCKRLGVDYYIKDSLRKEMEK